MPRLNVEITDMQKVALDRILEHGMRKPVFQLIIDDLIDLCETYGAGVVIGALVTKRISLKNICNLKGVNDGTTET